MIAIVALGFQPTTIASEGGNLVIRGIPLFPVTITSRAEQSAYANCDGSTVFPTLNVSDFACFLNEYAGGGLHANCDSSTIAPVLNVLDFACFLNEYAAGSARDAQWNAGVPATLTPWYGAVAWTLAPIWQPVYVVIGTPDDSFTGHWWETTPDSLEDPTFHPSLFGVRIQPVGGVVSVRFLGVATVTYLKNIQSPEGAWIGEWTTVTFRGSSSAMP